MTHVNLFSLPTFTYSMVRLKVSSSSFPGAQVAASCVPMFFFFQSQEKYRITSINRLGPQGSVRVFELLLVPRTLEYNTQEVSCEPIHTDFETLQGYRLGLTHPRS